MSDHYFRSAYYRNTLLPKEDVIEDPGRKGEYLVTCAVESYLRTKRMTGYIINNLLLELPGGRFSETDLILLSRFGLHVFEIKTRTGLITGGLNSKKWTQCSSSGIFEFQNPLLQNKTHIEHLAAFLSKETVMIEESITIEKEIFEKSLFFCKIRRKVIRFRPLYNRRPKEAPSAAPCWDMAVWVFCISILSLFP